jgi:GNAT superfamily N-acetyltransferase
MVYLEYSHLLLEIALRKFLFERLSTIYMSEEENLVVINRVNAENFNVFLGLIDKLAEYEKLALPSEEAKRRLRQDCLSDKPKFQAFIGKIGDKCISYVIYFFTYSSFLALPTLYIEDIFVLWNYRRQGVGQKMFHFLKETAKSEGCGRIEFTVLKWNTSAQQFYEKNKAKRLEWYLYRVAKQDF